ncbi:dCMP deaminase [Kwoniella mangroviensis CBS 10435]|uniref:Deoxycytidylate deaminase n=1 Tax=Kwoniella mangroviensis CBS 10435 TaxID=1331196 RepID=A0A1B9IIA4_9TREE|nr:dCMP deaminase [Kwoniella mangroviensis CBS 10435]
MFIAIIGTPSSGKQTILEYLEKKYGFKRVTLEKKGKAVVDQAKISGNELDQPMNEMSVSSSTTPTPSTPLGSPSSNLCFTSQSSLLDFITRNWLSHHVTTDLTSYEEIEPFVKRPFFLCVSVDGPILVRYEREKIRKSETGSSLSLEEFIQSHDALLNGSLPSIPSSSLSQHPQTDFKRSLSLAQISICNNFPTVHDLEGYLDKLNLVDEERLRPSWDTYFMTLASLASHRSNCMKRRVGALLVRSKRILSTGYNGTPRGTKNCNMGGCRRCNGSARGGEALDECLCLHAEENALLEAGRERIGNDSVIYCNTCPCLRCSVKIVQCGVREVVYNQSYSMDEASAAVLKEGGVILRQLHMPGQL